MVLCMNDHCETSKIKFVSGIKILLSKSTKGAARFNVPIWRTNRYQQYICLQNKYNAERDLRFYPRIIGTETSD